MTRSMLRMAGIVIGALALGACVDSSGPILPDADPIFGKQLRLQFYALDRGYAREPTQGVYTWNGALYTRRSGTMRDVTAFTVHRFEAGEYLIQSVPARRTRATEYALLRPLAGGVYLVIPIDEADADQATRAAYCNKTKGSSCRIETPNQLFAFARATAARRKNGGGLVLRLTDSGYRPTRGSRNPARR